MDKAIITTSWDDGHPTDLRLAELLNKYGISATFYIPIFNEERDCMSPQQINELAQVFDIGGHTCNHVNLTKISLTEVIKEITECKKLLEDIISKEISIFAYPWGMFNHQVIDCVEKAGFIGGRTTRSLTRRIQDPYTIDTTVNATNWWFAPYIKHSFLSKDPAFFFFMLRNGLFFKDWHLLAMETLDFVIRNGGVWHLWGHSWEIDQNSDWERLEKVLQKISAISKEVIIVNNSELIRMFSNNTGELEAV